MSVLRKEKGFYRSIFEATVCAKLDEDKVKFEYETLVIPYYNRTQRTVNKRR